jgi:hypothetical protein
MSRIKVTNRVEQEPAVGEFYPSSNMTGYGTVCELDGQTLPYVRSIQFGEINTDEVMTAKIEILASQEFEVDINADVKVVIVAFPGYKLVEAFTADGKKQYVCVPPDWTPA